MDLTILPTRETYKRDPQLLWPYLMVLSVRLSHYLFIHWDMLKTHPKLQVREPRNVLERVQIEHARFCCLWKSALRAAPIRAEGEGGRDVFWSQHLTLAKMLPHALDVTHFEEKILLPMFGFADRAAYYRDASSVHYGVCSPTKPVLNLRQQHVPKGATLGLSRLSLSGRARTNAHVLAP
jgi:hypothetical protein